MATDKVRVQTYLDPELSALLAETAKALGQSTSSLVAELIQSAAPILEVLLDLATSLTNAPDRHKQALAAFAESMRPLVAESQLAFSDLQRPPSL